MISLRSWGEPGTGDDEGWLGPTFEKRPKGRPLRVRGSPCLMAKAGGVLPAASAATCDWPPAGPGRETKASTEGRARFGS